MRWLKLFGLPLVVIFVFASAITSSAQATENTFRALPEKVKFEFTSKAGENTKLETVGSTSREVIECKKVTANGQFTSERLGAVELKFVECREPIFALTCTGLGDASGNITVKAEAFHIVHLLKNPEGATPEAAANMLILVGTTHFSCGIFLYVLSGCMASMDILTKEGGVSVLNDLETTMFVQFLQASGIQEPTSVDQDNSLGMVSCELKLKRGESTAERAGQAFSGIIENFKNTMGQKITALIDLTGTY